MINRSSSITLLLLLSNVLFHSNSHGQTTKQSPAEPVSETTRIFRFQYAGEIDTKSFEPDSSIKVWIPVPSNDAFQAIEIVKQSLPAKARIAKEPKFKNRILFFETTPDAGPLKFNLEYKVTRNEAQASGHLTKEKKIPEEFLQPNQLVPLNGKPIDLLSDFMKKKKVDSIEADLDSTKVLYDFVGDFMKYDKSQSGYGKGDVEWACESGTGNCTDFHSLFISVARANKIPAKFQIGFPLPNEKGQGSIKGYHCWAFFHLPENGWVPVDISEADKHPELKDYYYGRLSANRVAFSTGRDIQLVPQQKAKPLNYFVFPHVEVDGKVLDSKKLKMQFSYEDVSSK